MPGFHEKKYKVTLPNELLGPEYEAQSAACKQEQIWRLVVHDKERQQYFHGRDFEKSFLGD